MPKNIRDRILEILTEQLDQCPELVLDEFEEEDPEQLKASMNIETGAVELEVGQRVFVVKIDVTELPE